MKILVYHPPTPLNDPKGEWRAEVVDESMHMTHNFDLLKDQGIGIMIAGREGMHWSVSEAGGGWKSLTVNGAWADGHVGLQGIGEIRQSGGSYLATIEPMHGNRLMVYPARHVIDAPVFNRGIALE